jgi:hypothetical protein
MKEFLDGVTLQDLCDEARERCPSSSEDGADGKAET